MLHAEIAHVGNYCGRFAPGWFGEPQNSFTNVGFVLAGAFAWRASRRDPFLRLLAIGAFSIGVGSYLFHSHPTRALLTIDLTPIAVFTLLYVAYVARRFFAFGRAATIALVVAFAVGLFAWQGAMRGVAGGAASHLFALVAIAIVGVTRSSTLEGRSLLAASALYFAALVARALDLPVCPAFPWGLHWLWHLLQGGTVTMLLCAAAAKRRDHAGRAVER